MRFTNDVPGTIPVKVEAVLVDSMNCAFETRHCLEDTEVP